MQFSTENINLSELLKGIPPGMWVALSADYSRVIATGSSYGETVDRADALGEFDVVLTMTQKPGIHISSCFGPQ